MAKWVGASNSERVPKTVIRIYTQLNSNPEIWFRKLNLIKFSETIYANIAENTANIQLETKLEEKTPNVKPTSQPSWCTRPLIRFRQRQRQQQQTAAAEKQH